MRLRDKSRPSRQARLPLDWLNSFLIQAIHDHALRTFLRAQRKRNHISLYRRKGREIKKKKEKKKNGSSWAKGSFFRNRYMISKEMK